MTQIVNFVSILIEICTFCSFFYCFRNCLALSQHRVKHDQDSLIAENPSDGEFVPLDSIQERCDQEGDSLTVDEVPEAESLSDQKSKPERKQPNAEFSLTAKDVERSFNRISVQPIRFKEPTAVSRANSARSFKDNKTQGSFSDSSSGSQKMFKTASPTALRKKSFSAQRSSMNIAGEIQNSVYINPNHEEWQAIEEIYKKGSKIDARNAVKDILTLILSVSILRRCETGEDERKVFNASKAEERLKAFGALFSDTQKCALDILCRLEDLDKQLLRLQKDSFYFRGKEKELLRVLDRVSRLIEMLNEIDLNQANSSQVYRTAVQFYESSLPHIKLAITGNAKQLSVEARKTLNKMSLQLKLGTLYVIGINLNITMSELADPKLNNQMFYPHEEQEYHFRPPLPKGTPHAKELFEEIERKTSADADVDEMFKDMEALSTIYFSQYIPELEEDYSRHQVLRGILFCETFSAA